MIRALLLALLFAGSASVSAAWQLSELTYYGYCPPAAQRASLCKPGDDFTATKQYIAAWKLPKLNAPYVANELIFDNGTAAMAAVIRVPYTCWSSRLQRYRTCYGEYRLFADSPVCELTEFDQCQITYDGEAWEPASIPANGQSRDVTMRFRNTDCAELP